jgi:hypothetical protein
MTRTVGAFFAVVTLACACTKPRIDLYDPATLAPSGTKDKAQGSYTLKSGRVLNAKNISSRLFQQGDVGMSLDEVKSNMAALRSGKLPAAGSSAKRADDCWLMYEGGVGCVGCARQVVWEYCWDM